MKRKAARRRHPSPNYVMAPVSKVTYQYDAAGNRTSMNADGKVTNYTYNAANEVTQAGDTKYAYDNNGNMISQQTSQGTIQYGYTGDNLMNKVTDPDGTGVTYQYDGLRRLAQRTETNYSVGPGNGIGHAYGRVNGPNSLVSDTTNYVYDGASSNVLDEYGANGQPLAEFYNGANGIIAQQMFGLHNRIQDSYLGHIQTKGGLEYYEYDGLGNVMDITDRTGSQTMAYRYDAYGNLFTQMAAPYNDLGYTGQMYDAKAGLLDLSARWYNPGTGSFTTADTNNGNITNPMSLNLYTYAQDNPVNMTDPSGHMPISTGGSTPPTLTEHTSHYPTDSTTVSYVKLLQKDLNTLGFADPLLVRDGKFGSKTEGAVVSFQKRYGLYEEQKGVVGSPTWNKMFDLIFKQAAGTPELKYGSTGSAVKSLQAKLNQLGGFHLVEDGVFGRHTLEAVRALQATFGLKTDGIVGPHTWRDLLAPNPLSLGSAQSAVNKVMHSLEHVNPLLSAYNTWQSAARSQLTDLRDFAHFVTAGAQVVVDSGPLVRIAPGVHSKTSYGFEASGQGSLRADAALAALAAEKSGWSLRGVKFGADVTAHTALGTTTLGMSGDWSMPLYESEHTTIGVGGEFSTPTQMQVTYTTTSSVSKYVDSFTTTSILINDKASLDTALGILATSAAGYVSYKIYKGIKKIKLPMWEHMPE